MRYKSSNAAIFTDVHGTLAHQIPLLLLENPKGSILRHTNARPSSESVRWSVSSIMIFTYSFASPRTRLVSSRLIAIAWLSKASPL